ncbi:MAG TPA: hypothetical protein VFD58_04050 [Blastocatellia bacterium]|nr:hypothetical protein [Blastocatellia bacterium]
MSLEYAIEYKCEIRRRYDEPTLRALGRTGALISRVVAESVESSRPPSEESVQFATHFASEIERAEQVADYCRAHCPAHLEGTSSSEQIGCLGRITYPIEARFERFLADRLQLIYDTVAPEEWPHLLHILLDAESPFDGEATKELRRITTDDGLRFFDLRLPIQLARKAGRLTTDNIFDVLAGFSASDEGASGYQRELPVIALGDYAEFLEAMLVQDLTEVEQARLQSNGVTYSQYLRFAEAVRRAESLGVRVLMD